MGWIILASIVVIILWAVIAREFSNIAKKKGHYEQRWFWYTFLFSIAGCLMVVALPDRKADTAAVERKFDELPEL